MFLANSNFILTQFNGLEEFKNHIEKQGDIFVFSITPQFVINQLTPKQRVFILAHKYYDFFSEYKKFFGFDVTVVYINNPLFEQKFPPSMNVNELESIMGVSKNNISNSAKIISNVIKSILFILFKLLLTPVQTIKDLHSTYNFRFFKGVIHSFFAKYNLRFIFGNLKVFILKLGWLVVDLGWIIVDLGWVFKRATNLIKLLFIKIFWKVRHLFIGIIWVGLVRLFYLFRHFIVFLYWKLINFTYFIFRINWLYAMYPLRKCFWFLNYQYRKRILKVTDENKK